MGTPISRRRFLSFSGLCNAWQEIQGENSCMSESAASERRSIEEYFISPLHSYPLLQEMPHEMLVAEAEKKGIPTEGRTKYDIAKDLFLGG